MSSEPPLTIMIPLGGIGSRFQKEGYSRPKPFINVLGKPMLLWVLDNLTIGPKDEVVIVYDPNFLKDKYWPLVLDKYPHLRRVELPGPTRGAAETVLLGLQGLDKEGTSRPVMLCDGDTFYTADIVSKYRAAAAKGNNGVFYFEDTQPKPIYSYISVAGDTGLITDVKEKVKISDNANSGCYCFASGAELATQCKALLESGEKQLSQDKVGEYYTSGVIKRMLDGKQPFQALRLESTDFHVLGTPPQVEEFCTGWPEVPKMRFCFDLDNTLVTGPQTPGDYTTCLPIPENIQKVRQLYNQGHHIIIATARRMRTHKGNVNAVIADIGELTLASLREFQIPYHEVSFGKPWAQFYVDDLAVDSLADISKQTGFYFPSAVQAKAHATVHGTTDLLELCKRSEPYALATAFAAGAAFACTLLVATGKVRV